MKKAQRSLFDDPQAPNLGAYMPDGYDPFQPFIQKGMAAQAAADKIIKKKKKKPQPPAYIPPMIPGPGGKQVIHGTIPSKSNCYVIITMKPKKGAEPKEVECPECKGYKLVPSCGNCGGTGVILKEPKGHASLAKSAALKQYEKDFYIQCNQYRNKMIDGYFEVEVDVYYPNQRSDLDNSLKVLLDCLQHVKAFKNDNKCTRIVANKFLDPINPRIEFEVKTV